MACECVECCDGEHIGNCSDTLTAEELDREEWKHDLTGSKLERCPECKWLKSEGHFSGCKRPHVFAVARRGLEANKLEQLYREECESSTRKNREGSRLVRDSKAQIDRLREREVSLAGTLELSRDNCSHLAKENASLRELVAKMLPMVEDYLAKVESQAQACGVGSATEGLAKVVAAVLAQARAVAKGGE